MILIWEYKLWNVSGGRIIMEERRWRKGREIGVDGWGRRKDSIAVRGLDKIVRWG